MRSFSSETGWCRSGFPRRTVEREEARILGSFGELGVALGVADDLVSVERELGIREAALEVLEAVARGAAVQRVSAGGFERIAGFDVQVLAPEPGAPGDQVGAAYVGLRVVAPDGRSFCDFSDLDLDAQTVAAARLPAKCSVLLLPFGGRSRLSPELERAAIDQSTHLVASRGPGRVAIGFPPSVLRTDQEGTIAMPL